MVSAVRQSPAHGSPNAATIIAIDLDDRKLEWAKGIGATHTINAGAGDVVEAIQALTVATVPTS